MADDCENESTNECDDISKENDDDRISYIPVDRGWAWVTLAGTFGIYALFGGFLKSFGVLLLELSRRYSAPISLLTSSQSICSSLHLALGPLSNALSTRFNHRKIVFIGGLLAGVGLVLTAFIRSVELFFVTYGIITGIGFGLCASPTVVFPSYYFNKRLAIANGFTVAGAGAGAVIFPNLMRFLLDSYLIEGCLLIFGGIMLNICACAALFRPHSFWSNIDNRKTSSEDRMLKTNDRSDVSSSKWEGTNIYTKIKLQNRLFSSYDNIFETNDHYNTSLSASVPCLNSHFQKYKEKIDRLNLSSSADLDKEHFDNSILYGASLGSLPLPDFADNHKDERKITHRAKTFKNQTKIINWKLLKDPVFHIFNMSIFFSMYAHHTIYNFIPPLANELGLSDTEGALAISIIGFLDLAGRISGGFISDTLFLQRRTTFQIYMFLFGCCSMVVVHINSPVGFFITCGFLGIFLGGFIGTQVAVVAEALGRENISSAWGFVAFFSSIALLINPVIAGVIKDYTGSWIPALRLGASTAMTGSIIPCLKTIVDHGRNRK